MLNTAKTDVKETRIGEPLRPRSRSKTRWKKMVKEKERQIPSIKEEDESILDSSLIFEKVTDFETRQSNSRRSDTPKLLNLTEILRTCPNAETKDNPENAVNRIVPKLQKDFQKTCKKTVFNMN